VSKVIENTCLSADRSNGTLSIALVNRLVIKALNNAGKVILPVLLPAPRACLQATHRQATTQTGSTA
jgi:hypothetical protein